MKKKKKTNRAWVSQWGMGTKRKIWSNSGRLDSSTAFDLGPSSGFFSLRPGSTHLDAIQTSRWEINTTHDSVIGDVANRVTGISDRVWSDYHYACGDSLTVNISLTGVYFWPRAPVCMSQANSQLLERCAIWGTYFSLKQVHMDKNTCWEDFSRLLTRHAKLAPYHWGCNAMWIWFEP